MMRSAIVSMSLLMVASLWACGDDGRRMASDSPRVDGSVPEDAVVPEDAFRPVDAPPIDHSTECNEVIDVVFVIDISSTMTFTLESLGREISDVVTAAAALAPQPHFGFVGFADNHAFGLTGGQQVHTGASSLRSSFDEFRATYTSNDRNPGDGPSGPTRQNPLCEENSLDALYAAADEFPWRDNATRVIILATDDTFLVSPDNYGDRDGDGDTTSTDFPREGDYPALRDLAGTVSLLKEKRIRVFSFTRFDPPGFLDLNACGTSRRNPVEDITDGWTTPYQGGTPIPESTDGRAFDLTQVRNGNVSLSDSINDVVLESYCDPPIF